MERLATEVRHLQRSELREAEEFFHPGQKGSSSMPHKRNPVLSENLTGLARLVRAAVVPALENVTLWHERDITHSVVERVIAPGRDVRAGFRAGAAGGDDAAPGGVSGADGGEPRESGRRGAFRRRAAGVGAGRVAREDAYAIVQRNAMATWEQLGTPEGRSFRDNLLADREVALRLSAEELCAAMGANAYPEHVDAIFRRVFGDT